MLGAVLASGMGLLLVLTAFGGWFVHISYDLPFLFAPERRLEDVVLVEMDDQSRQQLNQPLHQMWDRSVHARLLDRLSSEQARLVIFDGFLKGPGPEQGADEKLAQAIKANGHVVLAGDLYSISEPSVSGTTVDPPHESFLKNAVGWGVAALALDRDSTVRQHFVGTLMVPSLPWVAAKFAQAPATIPPEARSAARWLRCYGPAGTLPHTSYYLAFEKPPGFFRGKYVFIGARPAAGYLDAKREEFRTSYTRWDGQYSSGMEILYSRA